jgi:hypothetical protein
VAGLIASGRARGASSSGPSGEIWNAKATAHIWVHKAIPTPWPNPHIMGRLYLD